MEAALYGEHSKAVKDVNEDEGRIAQSIRRARGSRICVMQKKEAGS
jgi:hypothetical protein